MALSRETITNAVDKLRGMLSREKKAIDAFGGDNLFEGEGKGIANLGPKIAIGVSGILILGLIGLVSTIVMTSDVPVPPTTGSLAGLQLEEDSASANPEANERRPWLTPTQPAGARRLGVTDDSKAAETKPGSESKDANGNLAGKTVALPTREVAKADTTKPTPSGSENPTEKKPEAPGMSEPVQTAASPPPTKGEKQQAPGMATAKPAASNKAAAKAAAKPEADTEPAVAQEEQVAGIPSLMAPATTAPGAPRRFENENLGPAAVGGRPRLNDPRLPPTEKTSIGAPPPRFAAIGNIKFDTPSVPASAKIAIVVQGLGLNKVATEAAIAKLPPSVAMAFSLYARDLKRLMERAKQKGHEVLIEVPMESKAFPSDDPGPLGLLTTLSSKENQDRLDTILKEATGAVGIYDSTGSKFRESQGHIGEVFGKLKQSNMFYVQGRPGIRASENEVPSVTADVVLDERPFRASVDARFDYAERLAKYQGSSVAVMDALPVSFERLALWIDQLPKKGIALAPISQVLVQ